MSDSDNIVLQHLRRIRDDLVGLKADTVEIKERLGLLEGGFAWISRRVDRIGGEVDEIRRRLELAPAR